MASYDTMICAATPASMDEIPAADLCEGGPCCRSVDPGSSSGDGYLLHKLTRQALTAPLDALNNAVYAVGSYRSHYAGYYNPVHDRVYSGDFVERLYDRDTRVGRTLEKALVPERLRDAETNEASREALRKSGARFIRRAHTGMQVLDAATLAGDLVALRECAETGCGVAQTSAVATDAVRVSLDAGVIFLANRGLSLIEAGAEAGAYRMLSTAQRATIGLGIFGMVAGTSRLIAETEHYLDTGDARGSAFVYGAIDALEGSADIARSGYFLGRARLMPTIKAANDVLSFGAVTFSPGLTVFLRTAYGASGFLGVAANGAIVADGLFEEGAPPEQRRKKVVSGSIGMVGSGLLIASAMMVATPLAPVSTAIYIGGMLVLAGQTIYDHFDEIAAFFGRERPPAPAAGAALTSGPDAIEGSRT